MSKDYIIAGFRLRVDGPYADLQASGLRGFNPFAVEYDPEAEYAMNLDMQGSPQVDEEQIEVLHEFEFTDARHDCMLGKYPQGYIFRMRPQNYGWTDRDKVFILPFGSRDVVSNIAAEEAPNPSLLRFGLWMMFGLAINPHHAVAVHSSVIVKNKRAVLFLGESGTGKSTHTRLWRENILNSTLLNDDSPIIRCIDGVPHAFGSAWSGKTPCYVNRSFPIRGIVRLSQAPHNKIRRLGTIEALGALLPSCPPAFAFDEALQDNICDTLSEILERVPVYHLECLPDGDAARLAYRTVYEIKD